MKLRTQLWWNCPMECPHYLSWFPTHKVKRWMTSRGKGSA